MAVKIFYSSKINNPSKMWREKENKGVAYE